MKHKQKVLELNTRLRNLFQSHSKITNIKKAFEKLNLTAKVIFRKEEAIYRQHGHPDSETHARLHHEFSRTLASFDHQYFITKKNKSEKYVQDLLEYIEAWINDHDLTQDMIMNSYIRISIFNGRQEQ